MCQGVLQKRANLLVGTEDSASHLEYAQNLPWQGELLQVTTDPIAIAANEWSTACNLKHLPTSLIMDKNVI